MKQSTSTGSNTNKDSGHKGYCSYDVQLTRVRSLQNLYLLQPVTLADFSSKPDKLLVLEEERLAKLNNASTLHGSTLKQLFSLISFVDS